MKNKLNPEIFELAAGRIARQLNKYCCVAIEDICENLEGDSEQIFKEHQEFFAEYFKPEFVRRDDLSMRMWWEGDPCEPHLRESRILAMLLCAEIIKNQNESKK